MLHKIIDEESNSRRSFAKKIVAAMGGVLVLSGFSRLFGKTMKDKGPGYSVLDTSPYVGEIALYPYNFVPNGWMACAGQLLPIADYDTLFNLIGTTYGGDGQLTFGLPDLQGRVAIHQGAGIGLSNQIIGERAGTENITLVNNQIPSHNHSLNVSAGSSGTSSSPVNNYIAFDSDGIKEYSDSQNTFMNNTVIDTYGSNPPQPHYNIQPYLAMTYCIALFGVYPPQN